MSRREGVYTLLCGEAGVAPFALGVGEFLRCERGRTIEECDATAVERRVELRFSPSQPVGSVSGDHWSGRAIRSVRFLVRVGYLLTHEGIDFDASGQQSGGAHRDAIEDRADVDRRRIVAVLGFLRNWAVIEESASHCVELAEHSLDWLEDRAVLTVAFSLVYRETFPGALTPELVGS